MNKQLLDDYFTGLSQVPVSAAPVKPEPPDDSGVPLVDRLKKVIEKIPDCMHENGMSLEYFRTRLRGRKRPTARTDEVSRALRSLGWQRRRDWSSTLSTYGHLWFPPSVQLPKRGLPNKGMNKR